VSELIETSMKRFPDDAVRIALTPDSLYAAEYSDEASRILSRSDVRAACNFGRCLPGYSPTPLVENQGLANECRVGSVVIKDEGQRMPTHSFKVLGPPYALAKQLLLRIGLSERSLHDLADGNLKAAVQGITACAATSGNHGRALAWACMQFGCQCRIYMPESTGACREEQIQRIAATTIRVPGTYDDAAAQAAQDAKAYNYVLVGRGAHPDSRVRYHILHGYSLLGDELVCSKPSGCSATHVFIPVGGGSLAAAVTGRLWMEYGAGRPLVITVQPHSADSAYQSCLKGARVPAVGDLSTLMDGLSVRNLAAVAWPILGRGAAAFVTIGDEVALKTLRRFDRDESIAIGETGIAAIAGFIAAANDAQIRDQLGLDEKSRVVLVATEGVTDPGVLDNLISEGDR
jgi:diaminopropionate ammonia-lyase